MSVVDGVCDSCMHVGAAPATESSSGVQKPPERRLLSGDLALSALPGASAFV